MSPCPHNSRWPASPVITGFYTAKAVRQHGRVGWFMDSTIHLRTALKSHIRLASPIRDLTSNAIRDYNLHSLGLLLPCSASGARRRDHFRHVCRECPCQRPRRDLRRQSRKPSRAVMGDFQRSIHGAKEREIYEDIHDADLDGRGPKSRIVYYP